MLQDGCIGISNITLALNDSLTLGIFEVGLIQLDSSSYSNYLKHFIYVSRIIGCEQFRTHNNLLLFHMAWCILHGLYITIVGAQYSFNAECVKHVCL